MRPSEELRGRTNRYASAVIGLYMKLPNGRDEVKVLGHQLLRSGTSVAAHTREASRARSDLEFCSKINGLLQETDESQLWLELVSENCGILDAKMDEILSETDELLATFYELGFQAAQSCRPISAFQRLRVSVF